MAGGEARQEALTRNLRRLEFVTREVAIDQWVIAYSRALMPKA